MTKVVMTSDEDLDDEEYGVQCASVKNNVATRANGIGHLRARLREKLVLFWHWLTSYVHCKTPGVVSKTPGVLQCTYDVSQCQNRTSF